MLCGVLYCVGHMCCVRRVCCVHACTMCVQSHTPIVTHVFEDIVETHVLSILTAPSCVLPLGGSLQVGPTPGVLDLWEPNLDTSDLRASGVSESEEALWWCAFSVPHRARRPMVYSAHVCGTGPCVCLARPARPMPDHDQTSGRGQLCTGGKRSHSSTFSHDWNLPKSVIVSTLALTLGDSKRAAGSLSYPRTAALQAPRHPPVRMDRPVKWASAL